MLTFGDFSDSNRLNSHAAKEIAGGFVVARCDGKELFDFGG
jgi:hypothetical protein